MTRVLVTRSEHDAARLEEALALAGFDVVLCPLIRTEPVDGPAVDAEAYDWTVFTSRAGVRYGLPRLKGSSRNVAAVGPGTAEELRRAAVEVALVPEVRSQRGLVDALSPSPGSILFPGAEGAGTELVDQLGAHHLVVYRTVELRPTRVPDCDLVALASGSAARALADCRTDLPCVTIGPSTSRVARERGLVVLAEAATADEDGLVEAVRVGASRLP